MRRFDVSDLYEISYLYKFQSIFEELLKLDDKLLALALQCIYVHTLEFENGERKDSSIKSIIDSVIKSKGRLDRLECRTREGVPSSIEQRDKFLNKLGFSKKKSLKKKFRFSTTNFKLSDINSSVWPLIKNRNILERLLKAIKLFKTDGKNTNLELIISRPESPKKPMGKKLGGMTGSVSRLVPYEEVEDDYHYSDNES